jgi:hypothetical protein
MKTSNKQKNDEAGISDGIAPGQHEFSERVAQAAYFLAEQRGFAPGFEMRDWLAAEVEVRAQMNRG